MAISNLERVSKGLELLAAGLKPFVERELKNTYQQAWFKETQRTLTENQLQLLGSAEKPQWDAAALLLTMWNQWNDVFRKVLGPAERSLVSELRTVRNNWAHQRPIGTDDAYRALDSINRLLTAVSAPEAVEVDSVKMELLRVRFEQQVRDEKKKTGGSLIEVAASGSLKSWRDVVNPHGDVATGRYQQAEFAADLWQVHLGQGVDEYRKPQEFFRRTFLTESLKQLLIGGVQRISGKGGDPVVQLQTNFGGGKTHSMLALYHLFSGVTPGELPGVDVVLAEANVKSLPKANRVVLVGNKISPGNPVKKRDGTIVRTLWGELAWQLGGKKAFERVKADDEKATSPGDALRELFEEYGPCLILIDEWVAYARQLHDQSDLPAGGFETQFSFAQALTESAKLAGNCLLVISLPASDTQGSPHTQADDVEVGGVRGREALNRLRNVVGRVESSWRPATAEEGFEIVRRRLFEPIPGDQFKNRDITARAFFDLYHAQGAEFPPECRDHDYLKRLQAAYPIHPEIFDQLYGTWSTLVKFQRTRGVLRLMAAVIHSLWVKGDRSPLILPSMIPIDDPRVQSELTRYLSDNWAPIIEKDVDGASSLPMRIDGEQSGTLGKVQATRRVARTVYLGSAPSAGAAHRGIEDRRIKLGCVMPGEAPAIFGDGLRRLAAAATYLYQDGNRYWYDSGKTSLMRMLMRKIEEGKVHNKREALWFNAWMYEGRDEAQSALIHAILANLQKRASVGNEITQLIEKLKKGTSVLKLGKFIMKSAITMTPDLEALAECFKDESDKVADTMESFEADFEKLLGLVGIDRIVVFVDDLDRCSSAKVIETFETIKLFLNTPACTFVVGADAEKIQQAVGEVYEVTDLRRQKDFIEKIVQIPFSIPAQDLRDIGCYVGMLIIGRHLNAAGWKSLSEARSNFQQDIPITAAEINRLHEEVSRQNSASRQALHAALVAAWRAGQLLVEEKKRVLRTMGAGAWLLWLHANFRGTPRTAQRYMRLAQGVTDPAFLQGMSLRQAYARLGIATEPKTPGGRRLRHTLPAHVLLANRLLRALKRSPDRAGSEQAEAYRRDLRALYERLRAWFETPGTQPAALKPDLYPSSHSP